MGRLGDVICLEVSVVAQAILIFVLLLGSAAAREDSGRCPIELLMAARIRLVVADVAIERRQIARWDECMSVSQSVSIRRRVSLPPRMAVEKSWLN